MAAGGVHEVKMKMKMKNEGKANQKQIEASPVLTLASYVAATNVHLLGVNFLVTKGEKSDGFADLLDGSAIELPVTIAKLPPSSTTIALFFSRPFTSAEIA